MRIEAVISGLLEREGGYVDRHDDTGGPTNMGITAATLGIWRHLGRHATRDEVRKLQEPEARAIYYKRYVMDPGFDKLAFEPLIAQMVDFGVTSGPPRAIRWLQRVLGVPVTGLLDDRTGKALNLYPPRLVNDALVAARAFMVDAVTDSHLEDKQFEEGWESRALSFFLSRPPEAA